jgi:anti-sigma factor RsiW
MLNCSDFLENYSGLRDGSLETERAEALRAHLTVCPSCARYDRVVSNGVEIFRELPALDLSPDFLPRLHSRIRQVEQEEALIGERASGASALLIGGIALAMAATAWTPLMRARPSVVELPPVAAHAPHRVEALEVLFRPGPLLTRTPGTTSAAPPATLFHDYSPLGRFASTPLRAP